MQIFGFHFLHVFGASPVVCFCSIRVFFSQKQDAEHLSVTFWPFLQSKQHSGLLKYIHIQRLMDNNVENVAVMVILYSTVFLFNSRVFSLLYLSAVYFISFPFKPAIFWLAVSVTSQRPKSREKWSETDCLEKSETWSGTHRNSLYLLTLFKMRILHCTIVCTLLC